MSDNKLAFEVKEILDDIYKLFSHKNETYKTSEDDLANFTKGALLLGYKPNEEGRFEALKAYVAKHISKVYNEGLSGSKMDESIMDIAVYFILAKVMHKRMLEEQPNE